MSEKRLTKMLSRTVLLSSAAIVSAIILLVANRKILWFMCFPEDELVRYEQMEDPSLALRAVKQAVIPKRMREKALYSLAHMNDALGLNVSLSNRDIDKLKRAFPDVGDELYDSLYEPLVDREINPLLLDIIAATNMTMNRRSVAFLHLVEKCDRDAAVRQEIRDMLNGLKDEALRESLNRQWELAWSDTP